MFAERRKRAFDLETGNFCMDAPPSQASVYYGKPKMRTRGTGEDQIFRRKQEHWPYKYEKVSEKSSCIIQGRRSATEEALCPSASCWPKFLLQFLRTRQRLRCRW